MKKRTIALLVVLAFSLLVVAGCSQTSTGGDATKPAVSKTGTAPDGSEVAIEKATLKFIKDYEAGKYQLLSTEDLNKWVGEKKDMIIIDTMPADFYGKNHIPGALNAELPKTGMADATDEQKAAFIKLLGTDKEKPIVVYCGFVGCARSDVGAVLALNEGFKNVYRVPGGFIAWQEAGYAVEK
ncbi:MAG: rhodanese-like domain-containing protein [Syntrophomonas sp.]